MSFILVCMECREPNYDVRLDMGPKPDKLPTVGASDCADIRCDHCDSRVFTSGVLAKKVGALQSRTGKDAVMTSIVSICMECHEPNLNVIIKSR